MKKSDAAEKLDKLINDEGLMLGADNKSDCLRLLDFLVSELGMLPPTNTCRLVPDEKRPGMMKHSECKREWDDESEPQP